jgi:hypothetical protein
MKQTEADKIIKLIRGHWWETVEWDEVTDYIKSLVSEDKCRFKGEEYCTYCNSAAEIALRVWEEYIEQRTHKGAAYTIIGNGFKNWLDKDKE